MQELDFDDVATAWSRWWQIFERGARSASTRIIELAQLAPGDRVLDLCTGLGEPAISEAKAVSPSGHVVGVDVSPSMLRLARERAKREEVTNVEFVEADAGAYTTGQPLDAITSRWGLMFLSDLGAALKHYRGQLRPGKRFATAVWASPPEVPLISLPMQVAVQQFGLERPPLAGGPFALHDIAALQQVFEQAGFHDVEVHDVHLNFPLSSPAEYFDFIFDVAPPLRNLQAGLDALQRGRLRQAVEKQVEERFSVEDEVRIPALAIALCAIA